MANTRHQNHFAYRAEEINKYVTQAADDVEYYRQLPPQTSVLHYAIQYTTAEVFPYVFRHDVPLEQKNENGETPLLFAAKRARPAYVKALINQGANIHATDNDENTALHLAVISDSIDNVKMILDQKAIDINAKNADGNTALHLAVKKTEIRQRNPVIIALLFMNGAKHLIANNSGEMPSAYIKEWNTESDYLKWGNFYDVENFHAKIQTLQEYAQNLDNSGHKKDADLIRNLSIEMRQMVDEFFQIDLDKFNFYTKNVTNHFQTFKTNFLNLLHSLDNQIDSEPLTLNILLVNLAIALTGVGILLISIQLIYSYMTQNRALLFFQTVNTPSSVLNFELDKLFELQSNFQTSNSYYVDYQEDKYESGFRGTCEYSHETKGKGVETQINNGV